MLIPLLAVDGMARAAPPPIAAVQDEEGRIYVAEWSAASNRFGALAFVDRIRGSGDAAANCRSVALGDFDGDGDDDLVAGRRASYCRMYVMLYSNDGSNRFRMAHVPGIVGEGNEWSMDLAPGDFDNDGDIDLFAEGDAGTGSLFLNDGAGRFTQTQIRGLTSVSRGKDAADFNEDGNLDLVRAAYSSGYLHLLRGRGDGSFDAPVLIADVGDDPYGVTAGDFDGDGHEDVIAVAGGSGDAWFVRGFGDGTFAGPVAVASLDVNNHHAWDAYDYDGDGALDIVGVNYSGRTLNFFRGSGAVSFSNALAIGVVSSHAMAAAAPIPPPPPGTPRPSIDPAAVTAAVGMAVAFSGAASADPGGTLVSNRWTFGDGAGTEWLDGAPGAVTNTYAAAGGYTVRLRVCDDDGRQAVAAARVVVTGTAPAWVASSLLLPESAASNGTWTARLCPGDFVEAAAGSAFHWNPSFSYDEDFESGAAAGWFNRVGSWSVSTNDPVSGARSLRQDDDSLDRAYMWLDRPVDGDFALDLDAKFVGGSGQEMIVVVGIGDAPPRYDNFTSFSQIILRGRGLNDLLFSGLDGWYSRSLPYVPAAGTNYHWRIEYRRGFADVWVDGAYLGGGRLEAGHGGKIGLATYRTRAVFDNIALRPLPGAPREAPCPDAPETFEGGAATNWTPTDGTWVVDTNAISGAYSYRQTDTSRIRAASRFNVVPNDDFVFETDVRFNGGTGQEAIFNLWGERTDHRYEILFRGRTSPDFSVRRHNPGETVINDHIPLPFAVSNNVTYRVGVGRERGWLKVFVGTNELWRGFDTAVRVNSVGLGDYTCDVSFDNVRLRPQGVPGCATYAAGTGTNEVLLTVAPPDRTPTSAVIRVVGQAGAAPVADAGGPYAVDEFSGTVSNGGWRVALDGTGSADAESGVARYEWDFGTETFDAEKPGRWVTSGTNVTQTGRLAVVGDGWAYSRMPVSRAEGLTFEARVRFSNHDGGYVGFKQDNDSTAWRNISYGLHNHNTTLYVVQDGAHISLDMPVAAGVWHDARIVLSTGGGASYYWRRPGEAEWQLVYRTTSGPTATAFRRVAMTTSGGTVEVDDLRETAAGASPAWWFHGPSTNPVVLTVWDHALQASGSTTTAACVASDPPAAALASDPVVGETQAVDRVWTAVLSAAPSSDDHGIWMYEWDFAYDPAQGFRPSGRQGVSATNAWTSPGTWAVAVRVTDHAGQASVATGMVTTVAGAPPVSSPGGPYAFDEFTGSAANGAWTVTLDGRGSSDAESSIVQYTWALGEDTFDRPDEMTSKWAFSSDAHITNDVLTFDWFNGNADSGHYCFTRDACARERGLRVQTRIRFSSANLDVIFGFRTTASGNTHWNQWVYGLHNENGTLFYVESGTHVSLGIPIALNTWYDWRIELKGTAGALYYVKPADSDTWTLVRDSTVGTTASFLRGYHLYRGGFEADSFSEFAAGPNPTLRIYQDLAGTNTISLTVIDQALQTNVQTTTLALLGNAEPVAEAGPDQVGDERDATQGLWWFGFSAAGSTDDHGLLRYEWDWDYDGSFDPSGEEGVTATHAFSIERAGTNTVAVRVTDHVLQTHVDTCRIVLAPGDPPVAILGPDRAVEVGWPLPFDGRGSTDDVEVARFEWTFGDGSAGTGPTPRHVYPTGGVYVVTLRVFDRADQPSAVASNRVEAVVSTPPTAEAGGPYAAGAGGPHATLDGRGSTDHADTNVVQGVARYVWDADVATDSSGDGVPDNDRDGVTRQAAWTYAAAGVYTAKLTVVDGALQTNSDVAVVQVSSNQAPWVICVPWRGHPNNRHVVVSGRPTRLKAVVRDAGTLTYRWDFGDGSTGSWATVTNPLAIEAAHTYTGPVERPIDAVLHVLDADGLAGADTYRMVIRPDDQGTRADIAVDEGLWWLHKDQDPATGYWKSQTAGNAGYRPSASAAAMQAFQMNGHRHTSDLLEDPYVETVRRGFAYLFGAMESMAIANQAAGNPDSNRNGIGIRTTVTHAGYQTGMAMDAIAASEDLLGVAPTGASNIVNRFFLDILTDMVDGYAWAQADSGATRGGWRYNLTNDNDSDNSIAQWGAIGMLGAENGFGISIPPFVRSESRAWLGSSYDASRGAYSYRPSAEYPWAETLWHATHPSAMLQMAVNGIFITNALWRTAERTLAGNWTNYYGAAATRNYYAVYAAVKALRLARPRAVTQFESNGMDWYHDPTWGVEKKIAGEQNADGSWTAWYRDNGEALAGTLSTAWGVTMLSPSVVAQPPVAVIRGPTVWRFGSNVTFAAAGSFHVDPTRRIVRYHWDLNDDGVFEFNTTDPEDPLASALWVDPHPAAGGDVVQASVRLRVQDDNAPALYDETSYTVTLRESPLPPFADAGGPYAGSDRAPIVLDGSASFDLDPGDSITAYLWDLNGDGVADSATNAPTLTVYLPAGFRYIGLRVLDTGAYHGGAPMTSEWSYAAADIREADSDHDGMDDDWERAFFFGLAVADGGTDWDGDGMPDVHEFRANTIPTNFASKLVLDRVAQGTPGPGLTVRWLSVTGRWYHVDRTTDLASDPVVFVRVATNVPGQEVSTSASDAGATNGRTYYYRIELAPAP